jgi:site-specific DNA-methyltransferase (adenine-specific)
MTHTLHLGDCRTVLATLDDNSIDAIVCDPPYELGFMGKAWDNSGIAYDVTVWQQCLRVLKPGGHLIAFGGSRTYHRLAVAIEDAGFEIRDQIQWIYGSGFPKSLDVSKAMDKQAGAIGDDAGPNPSWRLNEYTWAGGQGKTPMRPERKTAPSTDLAKQWQGWSTALKPAHEPAVLARKPLCGTVADNVTTWGVGALNIDGTRIGTDVVGWGDNGRNNDTAHLYGLKGGESRPIAGRWPANVILDEDAATALDAQSGHSKSVRSDRGNVQIFQDSSWIGKSTERGHSDSGGASRFFYTAKASKSEREAGLYYEEWQVAGAMTGAEYREDRPTNHPLRANHHPTVKPLSLMRYLVRLVTPPGGKVLDPFMGSGSTGCASILERFDFVGIDITPEYVAIAQKRIDYYAVTSPLEGF